MFDLTAITHDYLENLVAFLHSISWMFEHLNTKYVQQNVLTDHAAFLSLLSAVNLGEFVDLQSPQNNHPHQLQQLTTAINDFRISYEVIDTRSWQCRNQQKRMSVKKTYEIENMSELINEVCVGNVQTLVDLGSGLGYLDEHLHTKFGFKIVGLEGSSSHQVRAVKRQEKYYPASIGMVRHVQHFITASSSDFIRSQVDEGDAIGLFGLHPCGDLSITSMKLFLEMERVKRLIISPCCYHKMSARGESCEDFNFFPLSEALKELKMKMKNDPFNRPFLRLAGMVTFFMGF
jgi:hypothetical protein